MNLFALRVALKDEGAKRGRSLLVSIAPVSAFNYKSHQPPILLVGCKLTHFSKLELRRNKNFDFFFKKLKLNCPELVHLTRRDTYTYSCNLSLWIYQPVEEKKIQKH